MDGKGRFRDDIMIERLCRSVKYDVIYLTEYENVADLIQTLITNFCFDNERHPHQSLNGQTAAEVYWGANAVRQTALGNAATNKVRL